METIYDWILHNIGNEGNYLTILNVQRQLENEALFGLDIMARTKDFRVINLLIEPETKPLLPNTEPAELKGRKSKANYLFAESNQVITYLSRGSTVEPAVDATPAGAGIEVWILEPSGDSGSVSFPPR